MPLFRHLCQVLVCATVTATLASAHTESSHELPPLPAPIQPEMNEVQPPSYLEQLWSLSIFRFFKPSFAPSPELSVHQELSLGETFPACSVQPLTEIQDSEALTFENRTTAGLGAVDVEGMTPSTQLALARFQRAVTAAGGAIAITSGYRPASYQDHLRNVWETWMHELRYNLDPLCQDLRAQVREEFDRHDLLESQQPVASSDHTRGLSFDASVKLPFSRKSRKRRISIDLLARQAGIRRPDIRRDPVHFKLAM